MNKKARFAAILLVVAAFAYYFLNSAAVQAFFFPLAALAVGYWVARRFG